MKNKLWLPALAVVLLAVPAYGQTLLDLHDTLEGQGFAVELPRQGSDIQDLTTPLDIGRVLENGGQLYTGPSGSFLTGPGITPTYLLETDDGLIAIDICRIIPICVEGPEAEQTLERLELLGR
jgi:hypothetical protein